MNKVKATNLDLVFDVSGVSLNGVPTVMYANPTYDFTDDVVKDLNKGATSATKPAASPAKVPAKKP
jgi:hypothetical protein